DQGRVEWRPVSLDQRRPVAQSDPVRQIEIRNAVGIEGEAWEPRVHTAKHRRYDGEKVRLAQSPVRRRRSWLADGGWGATPSLLAAWELSGFRSRVVGSQ